MPSLAAADELRVATASNFREAMEALADRYEQLHGSRPTPIYGSTGKHYAQIVNGAPFDAYFAADVERPQRLEAEGRIVPGTRFTYALGRLLLWSPRPDRVDPQGLVLQRDDFRHLAIANPDLAPYGAAARSVLQRLGRWEALQPKLVRGENIAQTFQFVMSGNAELGFVAGSQLAAPGRSFGGSSWTPPADFHPPIEQQAVLLSDTPAGRAFLDWVRGEEALTLIRAHGYDSP